MDTKAMRLNLHSDPVDMGQVTDWLAEAGVSVELVEDGPDLCSVCHPPQMHAAA